MVQLFLNIFDFFQHKKRLCFFVLTALTCCLIAMMSTLTYNENIFDFLPLKGNEQKALSLYQDISGGQRIVAMIKLKEGSNTETSHLAEAVDTFANKIEAGYGSKHFKDITKNVDFEKYIGITDFIYQNIPVMLTDEDYIRMDSMLAEDGFVDGQLANDVQMLMTPSTGIFSTNIGNDPLGLFSPVLERLQSKQSSMPFEIDDGYIYTTDKKYAIVMMSSRYGAMESANNALLVNYVDSIAEQTMTILPDVEVCVTGAPVIAVGNASQIKSDSQWAISIAITFILLLLVFAFKKVRNLLLIGISILFGWAFAMAFIAVLRSDVSLIVLGIGSIIIGLAVNYPLHFIAHTAHGGTVRELLREMVAPLLIGNITTVGAFASLIPLDAPALRDLGLFAAFMLIGTILFVLLFLPHLVKKRVSAEPERLSFGRLSSMTLESHNWLIGVIVVFTFVFGYFSLQVSFDANMHNINYMTDEQKDLLSDLHASAGINDTTNVYIVTEGKEWSEALNRRSHVNTLLEDLKNKDEIKQYSDVTSFICSMDAQQKKINNWNEFWKKRSADVLTSLNNKAGAYGFSKDAFAGFERIINNEYRPQKLDYFEPIQSVLFSGSFSTSTGRKSVVDVISLEKEKISKVERELNEAVGDNGYSFDFVGMNSAIANSLSNDFNYIGFACGCIVFVFLWISFGRIELSILAFLPMALGWIWILGIMGLLGMQFNIVNVILATFIFGQGDDYTIFMTDGLINEYAYGKKLLPSFKNSIIISALIMFIGIGSLIIARHPALHSLAEVTIVGMLTVVLMAWVIPPYVFGWLTKTNGKYRHTPVTFRQVVRTIYSASAYIFELAYGCIFGFIIKIIPCKRDKLESLFHVLIYKTMKTNILYIDGIKSIITNKYDEKFQKGSILICNHQSILDPIYMLALNPHIKVLISGKVWKNPIVHPLFKLAGFINLDQPTTQLTEDIRNSVNKGYNVVIFPEGKRTNGSISRFHRGAFQIALDIKADILTIFLHGASHVMPKGSAFASSGRIDVEIGRRYTFEELMALGESSVSIARKFHDMYVNHYNQMKKDIEDTHYFHDFVVGRYIYKGVGVERNTSRLLKKNNDFSGVIDNFREIMTRVCVVNEEQGQFSLLFALVHPEIEVYSYVSDEDNFALINCMNQLPTNLHPIFIHNKEKVLAETQGQYVIDYRRINNRE